MAEVADAVVVGAGVIGGATAYLLAKEGLRVCLLDRQGVGSGASGHGHGVASLATNDLTEGAHFQLGLTGARMYPSFAEMLREDSGVDPLYHELPNLHLAVVEEEEAICKEILGWQRRYYDLRWIDIDECRQIEPRITPNGIGALLYRCGQVDAYRLSLAAAQAVERLGGSVLLREATGLKRQGSKIVGVQYRGGEISCGNVIMAMGPWAAAAREWLSFPVPVRPKYGALLHVRLPGEPLKAFISNMRHAPIHPRGDGLIMVGAIGGAMGFRTEAQVRNVWDPSDQGPWDFDSAPRESDRDLILQRALRMMPALENAELVSHLAGLRPTCADRLPLIGAVPGCEGAYLATGHGHKGIHLAPITGRIVADLVVRGRTDLPVDLEVFAPKRFAYWVGSA